MKWSNRRSDPCSHDFANCLNVTKVLVRDTTKDHTTRDIAGKDLVFMYLPIKSPLFWLPGLLSEFILKTKKRRNPAVFTIQVTPSLSSAHWSENRKTPLYDLISLNILGIPNKREVLCQVFL